MGRRADVRPPRLMRSVRHRYKASEEKSTMSLLNPGPQPIRFQRAMVFIDGTNLFHRLDSARLRLNVDLSKIVASFLSGRQVVRIYMYTIREHLERAQAIHGTHLTDGIRLVLGEGVPTGDGNVKEKGVDALLVADLVYHAAVKNLDYALVVSTDTDFVQALHRVEDFGCRTGVLSLCSELPPRLKEACDEAESRRPEDLVRQNWANAR
jgi:uncharacterized LabA/DUF88 family protein